MEKLREGVVIDPAEVEAYLAHLRELGRTAGTLETYRRSLRLLQRLLPEDRQIREDTLLALQGELVAMGYSPSTVNTCLSVACSFLEYLGFRMYQPPVQLEYRVEDRPELTRREYLRLLCAAREQGKERVYLLIKLFGTTGLTVGELPLVTVEAVRAGRIEAAPGGARRAVRFPDCLRRELLAYAREQELEAGPVFVTRTGQPMNRANVTESIRRLCREARVEEGKGNPRCLRRLCLDTQEGIRRNLELLAEQSYDRLLEAEQVTVGWNTARRDEIG